MRVVVLGSGLSGKLSVLALHRSFPECEVTLVGPESNFPYGLFYFNEKIQRVADKEITVSYSKFGDCSWEDYQFKSRGVRLPVSSSSKSSLYKAEEGLTETGYRLNIENNELDEVNKYCTRIYSFAKVVDQYNNLLVCQDGTCLKYDYLISTIPLPKFLKMLGIYFDDFKYKPIYVRNTFFTTYSDRSKYSKNPNNILEKTSRIDIEYNCSKEDPVYRTSTYYDSLGRTIVVSEESLEEIDNFDQKLIPGKIIPTNVPELYSPNIKIFGRYAKWEYHYLVTDTYRDAYEFGLSLSS